jgi:uncharacterized repeat protein (TIGR01451 family)
MRARVVLILTLLGLVMALTASPVAAGGGGIVIKSSSPSPVVAGGTLTYTITILNTGPADTVNVTDVVPAPFAVQSVTASTGTVLVNGQNVTWAFSLGLGAVESLTIVTVVDPATPAGLVSNTADAFFATQIIGASATATTEVIAAPPTPTPTPTPTPQGSLQNAAMAQSGPSNPTGTFGFAVLLTGALCILATINARRRAVSRS